MSTPPLVLLDTHVWVWLMEGTERLCPAARALISAAAAAGTLRVSAISVWEVAMLEAKGRLTFRQDCRAWVRDALASPGLCLVPLDPDIAVDSTRLPGAVHGDPADRIVTATARALGATLVTADSRIREYASAGHLNLLAAE